MKQICWDCLDGLHRPNCGCPCTTCSHTARRPVPPRRAVTRAPRPTGCKAAVGGARPGAGRPKGSPAPAPMQAAILVELAQGVSLTEIARRSGLSRDQIAIVRRDHLERLLAGGKK